MSYHAIGNIFVFTFVRFLLGCFYCTDYIFPMTNIESVDSKRDKKILTALLARVYSCTIDFGLIMKIDISCCYSSTYAESTLSQQLWIVDS